MTDAIDDEWLVGPDPSEAQEQLDDRFVIGTTIVDAILEGFGGRRCPIDPCANDLLFVQQYGLELDGKPFDFRAYKHLIDVYEDTARFLVIMAGAQTGKTGRIFVHMLRQMMLFWGRLFGYYFPDLKIATSFSQSRFAPFVRSQPDFIPLIGAMSAKGKGSDNVLTRTIGESTLFFLTTMGKSATEGLPLQGVWFDEVRRMARGDIERAQERYTAQEAPTDCKVSTAFTPGQDIHRFFLEGDQRYFHTACGCSNGIVLSLTFPNCIVDLRHASAHMQQRVANAFAKAGRLPLGMKEGELGRYPPAAYYCPTCDTIITDPQDGWWEPHNPGAWVHSYQMPQLLSPGFSAGRLMFRFEAGMDIQEFHNSALGLPFLDHTKRPVSEDHLYACVEQKASWVALMSNEWRERNLRHTAFGVDVQAGYLVLVVKMYALNQKHRTVHLEVIEDSPGRAEDDIRGGMWKELGRRMHQYDCSVCVIDNAPEWTAADRFARAFRGKVWLATYDTSGSSLTPIVVWGDTKKGVEKRQKGSETKFKHTAVINRVKGLRWSLGRWINRTNEIPDPRQLIQHLPIQGDRALVTFSRNMSRGTRVPVPIALTYFDHLQQFMFRDKAEDPENEEKLREGKTMMVAEYIGDVDPHFAHADLYCSIALSRIRGG